MDYIESQGIKVEIYWECRIREMLKKDKDMAKAFEEYMSDGPMELRDNGFFGGRTAPLQLYCKPGPDEEIRYLDVVIFMSKKLGIIFL